MTTEKTHHPLGIDPCDQQNHPIFNATTQKCNVVDTRTGLFEVYVPLPKITGNAGRGPVVDLGLFYTPVVNNHACLGDGWSFAFSFYNEKLKQLTLSTGEVLGFDRTQGGIEVSSIFITAERSDEIKVVLANKDSEILKKVEGTELWMPVTLATPEAHKVNLRWQAVEVGEGHYVRLCEVRDSARTLARIEYDEVKEKKLTREVRIEFWPDDKESLTYKLEQTNYALRSIKLPGHSEVKLSYNDHPDCGWLLNDIETFEGVKESVTYTANGIKFADEKLTRLPAVSTHKLRPLGGNANVVTAYNYFAADKDASWTYKTAMTQEAHVTTVYYGKDYSVVKEEEQEGGCTLNTSYEMESKDTGNRVITRQYAKRDNTAESTREEIQSVKWEQGEMRSRRAANKETLYFIPGEPLGRSTKKTQSYFDYPNLNRGEKAPHLSDEHIVKLRVVEFSKNISVDSAGKAIDIPERFFSALHGLFTAKDTVHIRGELTRQPGFNRPAMMTCTELNDWLKPTGIALCLNHASVGDPSWISVAHSYDQDQEAGRCSYGRLTGSWQGNILTKYQYSLDGTELTVKTVQTRILQAIPNSSRETSETCSILSGRLIKQTDVDGNETRYEYDDVGRLKKFIQCAQSATYKQATEYLYPRIGRVESIEPNGQHRATEDDGQGNVLAEYVKDSASAQWRQMLKVEYDAQGRKSKTTQFDYDADGKQMSESCVSTYDGWGQEYKQEFSDGRCLFNEYDPVTLTRREWSGLEGNVTRKVTTYNEDGSVANIAIGDASQAFEYTHAFQIARQVIDNEQEVRYSYDAFGRPLTESHGSYNPTAKAGEPFTPDYTYTYEYPQDITIREASKVSFDGNVLGERIFDVWGRVSSITCGGVTQTSTYTKAASVPDTRTVPGQTFNYTYIPELGNQLQTISGSHNGQAVSRAFTYPHGATRTASASEGERLLEFGYDLNEQPASWRSTTNSKATEVQRSFSPAGRLLTETDPAGRRIKYTYDAKGQRTEVEVDQKKVARHTYDKGLLSAEEVSHGEDSVKLSYEYDPSTQQETTRTFTLEGAFSLKLQRKFWADGKLRSISLSDANTNQTLGAHKYHYSSSGRLNRCTSSGIWQFKTPEGDAIDQQDFVYDGLGNVISCVTTFGNEHSTSTYTYDSSKGYRLIKVEHTHQDYRKNNATLTYDNAGRVTRDINGKTYEYDWLGRLTRAGSRYYTYDPHDHLVGSSAQAGKPAHRLLYEGFTVRGEYPLNGTTDTRYLLPGSSACQVQVNKAGNDTRHLLNLCDDDGTVLVSFDLASRVVRHHAYTAYGEHDSEETGALHGFNGEYLDAKTQAYPLGHGYRWYSPQSMQFQAQDSLSPFDEGGPNAYGYCDGDPVNYKDRSGHFKWRRSHWDISRSEPKPVSLGKQGALISAILWAGVGVLSAIMTGGASLVVAAVMVGLTAAAGATGIAAVILRDSDPKAAEILGWISVALSVAGGLKQLATKVVKLVRTLSNTGKIVAQRVAAKWGNALQGIRSGARRIAAAGMSSSSTKYKLLEAAKELTAINYKALAQPDGALGKALEAFTVGDFRTIVRGVTGVLHNVSAFENKDLAWTNKSLNSWTRLPWGKFGIGRV